MKTPGEETSFGFNMRLTGTQLSRLSASIDASLQTRNRRNLGFTKELEDLFEREISRTRRERVFFLGLIAAVVYDLFLFLDTVIIQDIFITSLIIRLGIITPLILIVSALIYKGKSPIFREVSISLATIVVGISNIVLIMLSNSMNKIFYHPGLILVIIYCNLMARLKFRFALFTSITLTMFYVVFYPSLPSIPSQIETTNIAILIACVVLTLFVNFMMEVEQRRNFLLTLRERIRRGELTVQNRKLSRLATLDPLTKLANRREIDEYIEQLGDEIQLMCLSVIMVDIDHFKKFNDTYGHIAGDTCLQKVARELRDAAHRQGDMVGRIGGEEFILFLPNSNLEDARLIAEKIVHRIFDLAIPNSGSPIEPFVTISAGVSSGEIKTTSDAKNLIESADQALYCAKNNGRNQVAIKQEETT